MQVKQLGSQPAGIWKQVTLDRKALWGHLLLVLAVSALVAVGFWLDPNPSGHGTHRQMGFPPCTIYYLTGRLCPSCGMTTSVSATLHGKFALAWRANPFGIAFILLAVGAALNSLSILTLGKSLAIPPKMSAWGLGTLVVLWMVYAILRLTFAVPDPPEKRLTEAPQRSSSSVVISTL
jgi:hypothetical protein